jgi:hypothetical protein
VDTDAGPAFFLTMASRRGCVSTRRPLSFVTIGCNGGRGGGRCRRCVVLVW